MRATTFCLLPSVLRGQNSVSWVTASRKSEIFERHVIHSRVVFNRHVIRIWGILGLVLTVLCNVCKVGNFPRSSDVDFQLLEFASGQLESIFRKMGVANWMSNSQIQPSRRRLSESNLWEIELGFQLPEVGSSKLDTTKLVGATRLNTFSAQKCA